MNCTWALFLHHEDEGKAVQIPLPWKSTFRAYKMSTIKSHVAVWWEHSGENPAIVWGCGGSGQAPVKPCPLVHSLEPWFCSISLLLKVDPVVRGIGCCCKALIRRAHAFGVPWDFWPRHLWPPRTQEVFPPTQKWHKKRREQRWGQAFMILNGVSLFHWHCVG